MIDRRAGRIGGAVGLLIFLSGCIFGDCNSGPPAPEACAGTVDLTATVDEIALFSGGPEPLEDGDVTEVMSGIQGSPMLLVNVGWRAPDPPPECARVRLRVLFLDGRQAAAVEYDVTSFDQPPWQMGSTIFVIISEWDDRMVVEATAFGQTISREVEIGGYTEPDAGYDAGTYDAGVDAGPYDAGDYDAGTYDAGDVDAGDVDAGDVDAGP